MKQNLISLYFVLLGFHFHAQNSFQTSSLFNSFIFVDNLDTGFRHEHLGLTADGIITLGRVYNSNEEYVSTFDLNGTMSSCHRLQLDGSVGTFVLQGESSNDSLVAYASYGFIVNDAVIVYNSNTQEAWSKPLVQNGLHLTTTPRATGISNGNIIFNTSTSISEIDGITVSIALNCDNANGDYLWSYAYALDEEVVFIDLKILANGNILIMFQSYSDSSEIILLELTQGGLTSEVKKIDTFYPCGPRKVHIADSGDIYLIGGICDSTTCSASSSASYDAMVIKINVDYEVQWAKRVILEKLKYKDLDLYEKEDGNLIISYSGYGDLPITVFEFSNGGEVLWQKGHSFRNPTIKVLPDNSIVFLGSRGYTADGEYDSRIILARTNQDGSFDDCSTYTTCVEVEDIELIELNTTVAYQATDSLPLSYSVTVTPVDWEFEEYCNTPPAPTPNFHHPDTICLNACPAPDSLENFYAHAQEWTITAPDGSDTLMLDKAPEYCFTQEGTYLIEQTIWFLGCDYSYEQTVEVVPAMNINLGDDGINCNALPYELTLQSNRPIMSYEWSDGSTNPTLMLTESGTYWVAAEGPYCESVERDTIAIEFIEDYVDLPLFSLPNDTSICIQHYPYTILPQSSSALSYTLNGATNAAPSHAITQAGSYIVATTLEGCTFQDTINITTNDCQASIYLPNAFSPNFDGVNDELFPQGIDFETISLEVFDRWGGLVAQSTGSRASWDGVGASVGVYVIQLTYRNLLSNEVEVLVKDVVVIR